MMLLPKNIAAVINKINSNIITDCKDVQKSLLTCFFANGGAFYDNLFMLAMIEEVKVEKREKGNVGLVKKLQELIEVGTILLYRKVL